MLKSLAQVPRIDGSGLVILEKPRPVGGIGWATDGDRCQDWNPDGICNLVALPQPPVAAAERERSDGSDQESEQGAEPSGNEQPNGKRRARGACRRLQNRRRHGSACWLLYGEVMDVATG